MKNVKIYNRVNVAVLTVTLLFFFINYRDSYIIFLNQSALKNLLLMGTVILVHAIKSFRLYFVLYGTEGQYKEYLKTYCKATSVGIILPFKLGEIFRMYCYGLQESNILRGIVVVVLDRFFDTSALVTMIFGAKFILGGHAGVIQYFLLLFLVITMIIYYVFPGMSKFWKKFFLKSKASKNKLWGLKNIETLQGIYTEIENIVKGRGIILYFLSFWAWIVEIGCIVICNGSETFSNITYMISNYLLAAIGVKKSHELNEFIYFSAIGLIVLYVILRIYNIFSRKEE